MKTPDPKHRRLFLIAAAIMAALIGLQAWQIIQDRRIAGCQERGGRWHPATATCLPGVIIQRDIRRL